jgi:ribosomal protein S18 acetylase RimI-like enzyme
MEQIEIRLIGVGDVLVLQQLACQTFTETFAHCNTPENLSKYLEEKYSVETLGAELANPLSVFYIAACAGKVAGFLKLNTGAAQTELQEPDALEIERIYVLQEFHGKGVGQVLFDKAIAEAVNANCRYVWLGVWEENYRAIRFYTKNGFVKFDTHIFKMGDDEQTDWMMKRMI